MLFIPDVSLCENYREYAMAVDVEFIDDSFIYEI